MIKKVIFDLDNTLIMWKKDYINALIDTMKCFDVKNDPAIIDDIIESLEKKYEIISKEILLNDINRIPCPATSRCTRTPPMSVWWWAGTRPGSCWCVTVPADRIMLLSPNLPPPALPL